MNIYYWDDLRSLANFNNGMAISYANSLEEAIQVLIKDADSNSSCACKNKKELEQELRLKNPTIHDVPIGFCIVGDS